MTKSLLPIAYTHVCLLSCLVAICVTLTKANEVKAACSVDVTVCRFTLIQQHIYSMMSYTNGQLGLMLPVVAQQDGLYTKRQDCSGLDKMSEEGTTFTSLNIHDYVG